PGLRPPPGSAPAGAAGRGAARDAEGEAPAPGAEGDRPHRPGRGRARRADGGRARDGRRRRLGRGERRRRRALKRIPVSLENVAEAAPARRAWTMLAGAGRFRGDAPWRPRVTSAAAPIRPP